MLASITFGYYVYTLLQKKDIWGLSEPRYFVEDTTVR